MTLGPSPASTADPICEWRGRLIRQRREREERREMMLRRLWQALSAFESIYGWKEAFAFGSITRPGAFTRRSDVDVAVSGMASDLLYRAVGELSGFLGVAVDLVRLEECRFAEKVRCEGIPWKR